MPGYMTARAEDTHAFGGLEILQFSLVWLQGKSWISDFCLFLGD